MARFILKWRYIKANSKKHSTNLVKYIATREGVEKCDESWKHQPATIDQQRLINNLVADFPESVQSFEYQDYTSAPTKKTASDFIGRTIEDNLDLIGKKENYVGYIAMRPRVEKQGAHGLFTQKDSEINLAEIAKTVAEHEGAVWTTVMSLRREDAEKLGYDNAKAWRDLLRGQSNKLAKAMGIPLADLRWYAAFHNEGSHPHIHLVSYSAGKEPYMTEQGLQSFKADFAREIFKQDNLHIYHEQTAYRDELRRTGREKMSAIVREINNGAYDNETVKIKLRNLVKELDNYTGRMVYGYMPKKAKNLIDGVVDELAKDERIAELYNLWYEQRENIVLTYQDSMPQRITLSQNKEFRAIKNAVIQEALNLLHNNITFEDDVFEEEPITDTEPKTETKRNPWTDPEDMRYQYIRGKSYLDVESEDFDPDEAVRWLELSAEQGFDVAMYRLGKLYLQGDLIEKNIVQALYWLHKADEANNQYAQYLLAEAQKMLFENQQQLAAGMRYLLILGASSIAMNRIVIAELESKLKKATAEQLSEAARQELIGVIKLLREQESAFSKQDRMSEEIKAHGAEIVGIKEVDKKQDKKDKEHDDLIAKNATTNKEQDTEIKRQKKVDEQHDALLKQVKKLAWIGIGIATIALVLAIIALAR